MATSYAPEMAPVPFMAMGPNEESGVLAGELGADSPSSETHKIDLSVPEGAVSRLHTWRRIAQSRVARVAAFVALSLPVGEAITSCNTSAPADTAPGISAPGAHGGEAALATTGDPCILIFDQLQNAERDRCRDLITHMEIGEVTALSDAELAQWARIYRVYGLGENSSLDITSPSVVLEQSDSPQDTARTILVDHQTKVYTQAWLLQNKPDLAHDPRTLLALFGSADAQSESNKLATLIADNRPADGFDLFKYVIGTNTPPLMDTASIASPHIAHNPHSGAYTITFDARALGSDRNVHVQHFESTMYPLPKNKAIPEDQISAMVGVPLVQGVPTIKPAGT